MLADKHMPVIEQHLGKPAVDQHCCSMPVVFDQHRLAVGIVAGTQLGRFVADKSYSDLDIPQIAADCIAVLNQGRSLWFSENRY